MKATWILIMVVIQAAVFCLSKTTLQVAANVVNKSMIASTPGEDQLKDVKKSVRDAEMTTHQNDVGPLRPHDECFGQLGCFSMSYPWFTVARPIPAPSSPEEIDTHFYLYTRAQPQRYNVGIKNETDFSVDNSDYDGGKETFFITHGFASDGNSSWLSDMKNAILDRYDGNVILVDWGKGASNLNYFQVAANTRVVGATLAKLGQYLIDANGANSSRFHLIGHSLGAHVSSYMAKRIPGVAKLTALDPAQPAFEGFSKKVRLDISDAGFVQLIHTTARPFIPFLGLGMISTYGHVDFYMNGGGEQPGCILPPQPNITSFLDLAVVPVTVLANFISCPHGRAYEFLTASLILDNCTFWGHRTKQISEYGSAAADYLPKDRACTKLSCSPLGFEAINYPARGRFRITTTADEEYCIPNPKADRAMKRYRNPKAG